MKQCVCRCSFRLSGAALDVTVATPHILSPVKAQTAMRRPIKSNGHRPSEFKPISSGPLLHSVAYSASRPFPSLPHVLDGLRSTRGRRAPPGGAVEREGFASDGALPAAPHRSRRPGVSGEATHLPVRHNLAPTVSH